VQGSGFDPQHCKNTNTTTNNNNNKIFKNETLFIIMRKPTYYQTIVGWVNS
jgi:hypothetical protein